MSTDADRAAAEKVEADKKAAEDAAAAATATTAAWPIGGDRACAIVKPLNRSESSDTRTCRHVRTMRNPKLVVPRRRRKSTSEVCDSIPPKDLEVDGSSRDHLDNEALAAATSARTTQFPASLMAVYMGIANSTYQPPRHLPQATTTTRAPSCGGLGKIEVLDEGQFRQFAERVKGETISAVFLAAAPDNPLSSVHIQTPSNLPSARQQAAEECTSVLELDTEHAGALMLRAQTLVTLKDYQSALFDVNRLIEINPSSEVYRNLHARLKTQLSLAPIPESEEESLYTEEDKEDLPPKDNTKNETVVVKSDQPSAKVILENKPVTKALKVEVPPNLPSKPEGGGTIQKPKGHSELDHKEPLTEAPKVQVSPSLPSKPECRGTIQKPKGHSGFDYSKWDKVEDDSSEDDEDDEEDDLPRYKFKVRTIGVRTVK
ncbi:hypothetical protein TRIUR3_07059 [Triticum urartu]|uniref:Uncharacterized protein n=1 Tax=Triticum urartu TaxID=4572 RepID=M7ZK73_TRIUA|nr:hypothetical protein TRIUR3_07059 [Triticum urartu]